MFIVGILFVYRPVNALVKKLSEIEETNLSPSAFAKQIHRQMCSSTIWWEPDSVMQCWNKE
jgi:hypothetical protein